MEPGPVPRQTKSEFFVWGESQDSAWDTDSQTVSSLETMVVGKDHEVFLFGNFINENLVKVKDLEGPRQLFPSVNQQDSPR